MSDNFWYISFFRGAPPHVSEGSAAPLLCANVYESVENEKAAHINLLMSAEFIESLVNVVILPVILMRNFNFHAVFGFQFQSDLKVNANSNMHWT